MHSRFRMCPPRWRRLLPTLALLLAACSGDDPARPKPVSVIHISPDTAYVRPGTSQQLTASARDAGGALVPRAALVWASSDTAVATVTQTGLVTARALGDAVVTAVADGVTGRSIVRVPGSPGVRILSGDGVTDTIGALLSRPLVVEVRDGRGLPLQGVRVVFRAPIETRLPTGEYEDYGQVELANLLDAGNYYPWLSGPTDILGRASAYLRFGPAAKEARVEIQVPTPGYSETARYTIRPGNPASVRLLPAHGALYRHRSATIRASVLDRRGNSRPDSVGLAARPGLRIEGRTVTGEAFGEYWVRAIVNGRALDSTSLAVVPDGTLAVIQMDWDIALETLYLVDLDGSNRRRVRSFIFRGLQWMPDGSGVVVRVGRGGADETDEPAQFWFIAPDGAQRRVAPDAVGLPDDYPALSRDGRWIYFAGRGRITRARSVRPPTGGGSRSRPAATGQASSTSTTWRPARSTT